VSAARQEFGESWCEVFRASLRGHYGPLTVSAVRIPRPSSTSGSAAPLHSVSCARIASLYVLVGALTLCGGCSEPPSPDSGASGTRDGIRPSPVPLAFDSRLAREPRSYFPGRVGKLPPWGEALRARLEPRRDSWPGEAIVPRLSVDLGAALSAALGSPPDLAPLRALLAPGGVISQELLPKVRTERLRGSVHVDTAREFGAAADVEGALAGLGAALDVGGTPRCEVVFETLEPDASGGFEADLALRASCVGASRVQATLELTSTWIRIDGNLRLARLEPRSASLVSIGAPLVLDATEGALGREPWFRDDILLGTDTRHGRRDRLGLDPFLGMQGLAVGDVDADGLEDLYVCQSSGMPNRLLVHAADGTARDVAAEAGVAFLDGSSGAILADLDGDGDEDLAVATGNVLLLSWNDGSGHFPEGQTLAARDAPEIYSIAAGDPDQDGDLDLYAARYAEGGVIGGAPVPYHDAHNGAANLYWQNEGARRFRECAAEVGLDQGNDRFSLASVFEDLDDDGDVDLYVTNDFGRNNLYENRGGRFVDVARAAGAEDIAASMGAAIADVDLDGDLDIYVTNMESAVGSRIARSEHFLAARPADRPAYVRHARGNTLLRGSTGLRFTDAQETSGARRGGWAWGATFTDWNGDGLPDAFVPNGFITGSRPDDVESFFWRALIASSPAAPPADEAYLHAWQFLRHLTVVEGHSWNGRERDDAYVNLGGGDFVDASRALGVDFEGDGRTVARCDWDGDLAEDCWLAARTGPRLRLLLSADADPKRSVAFELAGTRTNRQGVGATVFVETGGRTLRGSVRVGDGYLSSSSKRVVLRAPSGSNLESVRVRWPGGALETFSGVEFGSLWRLVEGSGRAEKRVIPRGRPTAVPSPWIPEKSAGVGRIVLDDRLPVGIFELHDFGGPARPVSTFGGRALLVTIGRAAEVETQDLWAVLAAQSPEFEAAGVVTWALAFKETGKEAEGRALLEARGQKGKSGHLDTREAQALEVLLLEILGPFERIPLPLVLLIDRGGSIALVRCGPVTAEALRADALAVAALDPRERGTERLVGGGRWARRPERGLGSVGDVFEKLGRPALAAWYREQARMRSAR